MQNKNNIAMWGLVLIVFIGGLIFIINRDKNMPAVSSTDVTNNTMQNPQQDGVKITIRKEGTGEAAKVGDTVAMNYTGTLSNGMVFDSNVDPKFQHVQPFIFTIGAGQVIKGWDVGVAGMKVGEKRELELSPDYAYGSAGAGGVIPPNATLIFEVQLLSIKK